MPEVRLHIGAHKTATTHLQDNLAQQDRLLLRNGWLYLPRPLVRQVRLLRSVHANYLNVARPLEQRHSLEAFFQIPPNFPRRFIVSEEDILGMSIDLIGGLYPNARDRLLPWEMITPPENTHIYLAIRDYAELIPSAYSQALRDGTVPKPFAVYRDLWLDGTPSWLHLIATIRSVFPKAKLTVWTTDHYLKSPVDILRAFSGSPVEEVKRGAPQDTRRLTAEAVRRIEALSHLPSVQMRRQALTKVLQEEVEGERFDPFAVEQKQKLSQRYHDELAQIRRLPLTFLG